MATQCETAVNETRLVVKGLPEMIIEEKVVKNDGDAGMQNGEVQPKADTTHNSVAKIAKDDENNGQAKESILEKPYAKIYEMFERKLRNLMKRKERLNQYETDMKNGKKLMMDQIVACKHIGEVDVLIEFVKEANKLISKLTNEYNRTMKRKDFQDHKEKVQAGKKSFEVFFDYMNFMEKLNDPLFLNILLNDEKRTLISDGDQRDLIITISKYFSSGNARENLNSIDRGAVVNAIVSGSKERVLSDKTGEELKKLVDTLVSHNLSQDHVEKENDPEAEKSNIKHDSCVEIGKDAMSLEINHQTMSTASSKEISSISNRTSCSDKSGNVTIEEAQQKNATADAGNVEVLIPSKTGEVSATDEWKAAGSRRSYKNMNKKYASKKGQETVDSGEQRPRQNVYQQHHFRQNFNYQKRGFAGRVIHHSFYKQQFQNQMQGEVTNQGQPIQHEFYQQRLPQTFKPGNNFNRQVEQQLTQAPKQANQGIQQINRNMPQQQVVQQNNGIVQPAGNGYYGFPKNNRNYNRARRYQNRNDQYKSGNDQNYNNNGYQYGYGNNHHAPRQRSYGDSASGGNGRLYGLVFASDK